MKLPIYCILNGDRAVKAIQAEEGGLTILDYYPADDEFRGGGAIILRHILFPSDYDVENVTKEEFDAFVERQRAKYQADPELDKG